MITFSRVATPAMVLVVCLFGSTSLRAEYTVMSGMFDGSEPDIPPLQLSWCAAGPAGPAGYRQTSFTVSETGTYGLNDAFTHWTYIGGLAVQAQVYEGSFDPAAPNLHLKHFTDDGFSSFSKGVAYTLVVQDRCGIREGAWAVVFSGPGSVDSDFVVAVPGFTHGRISESDPTMASPGCEQAVSSYRQSGPIRVSRSGTYYLTQTGAPIGPYVTMRIYTAPVNPNDQQANLVPQAPSGFEVNLLAGQDYYFVAQQCYGAQYGEYFYVVAPPAALRINPGLSGTWYNPDTPGQGFFLTVYEKLNQVFLGWFTFADDAGPGDEYSHRWLTAFGPFAGETAQLAIEWTSGGGFDAAQPAPSQDVVGDMRLDFTDCSSGRLTYVFGPGDTGGSLFNEIQIRRHTNEAVALCESLYVGPGVLGPL